MCTDASILIYVFDYESNLSRISWREAIVTPYGYDSLLCIFSGRRHQGKGVIIIHVIKSLYVFCG
jgi:hypothetical protein